MKETIYKNKKTIVSIGVIFVIVGIFIGIYTYGTEPWETIGGVLCGIGLSTSIIASGLKNPKNV